MNIYIYVITLFRAMDSSVCNSTAEFHSQILSRLVSETLQNLQYAPLESDFITGISVQFILNTLKYLRIFSLSQKMLVEILNFIKKSHYRKGPLRLNPAIYKYTGSDNVY